MPLPSFLKSCLWSYDVAELDEDEDYWLIINQVLNWGDEKQVNWMKENYSVDQIRAVLRHPRRGMWFREKLRRWLGELEMMIDPLEFEAAVIDLTGRRVKLTEAVWQRKDAS